MPANNIHRRLKLRDLDTLLVVARCGSMAKAAGELAISQPAVSKAIGDMEHLLGVQLFDRTTQGVEPTRYGNALLRWSKAIFDDVRQGVKEIEFLANPTVGELRIGASEPMLGGFLAAVLSKINRRYPGISFNVHQPHSLAAQRQQLRERQVDLLVGRIPPQDAQDDLLSEILFDEEWSIVTGPGNPLARRRKLALADLLSEPWTLPPADSVAGRYLEETFRKAGLKQPQSVVTCGSIQMHYALMARGPFLAVFPDSLLRFSIDLMALKVLPVKLPGSPPPVGITTLKGRTVSPVTQLFLREARRVADPRTVPV
jgi:DNA-binding transcriptional LysR family regulator